MAHITTLTKAYDAIHGGQANTYSYSGSFETFKESEVKVKHDGTLLTYNSSPSNNTQYSVNLTNKTITLGGSISSGTLSIYPQTDLGDPTLKAPYTAGSAITATDLTNNQKQTMRKLMEHGETKLDNTGGTMTGDLTIGEDKTIIFEGATDDGYETTLTVADPDADRTVTLPNATDTLVGKATTDTLTNKTVALGSNTVSGTLAQFNTAVTDATLVSTTGSETLTNKTLTSPVLNSTISGTSIKDEDNMASNSASHLATQQSIKAYTDSGSQTLTNKTISADNNTLSGIAASSFVVSNSSGNIDGSASQKAIPSGTVVGTSDSQTLTNKSIDSDNNTITNIVNADIKSSAAIDHSKLAAVSSGNIIVGNGSNVPTSVAMTGDVAIVAGGTTTIQANSVEFGMIGCEQTAGNLSNSDVHLPTSAAVVDYVTDTLTSAGSFEVIADELNFPATHPDPKASDSIAGIAGMVVSIQNAGGLRINSSGVATNARKAGSGSDDITINGFPNSMRGGVGGNADPYELSDETGLLVTTTAQTDIAYASGAVYEFHRIFVKPADYVQLSDDINDFKSRYRVSAGASGVRTGQCGADGTGSGSYPCNGDMFWSTGSSKMYVYDKSGSGTSNSDIDGAWGEVTSTGDFKFLTVKDHDQSSGGSGPTFNGSNEEFDLFDGSSDASINSAAQLIVVLNGVVQKPNSGTFSGSEEGFYLNDTHGIKFCDPPPSGSTLFVTQIGSAVTLNEPADNSVSATKIQTGAVSTAKIDDDAVTGAKLANNLDLPDNNTIRFGASNDLQIYHDSSHSYIKETGTGQLKLQSSHLSLQSTTGEEMLVANPDGAVELYYDNTKRLETSSVGATVTGQLHVNSGYINVDDNYSYGMGTNNRAQLYHSGSHQYLLNTVGNMYFMPKSGEYSIACYPDGDVELYYDNSKKFETTSSGVLVSGHLDLNDGHNIKLGSGDDLQLYHDGTDSYIVNQTGSLYIIPKLNENGIQLVPDGTVKLYYDNSAKFETTSYGTLTTGESRADNFQVLDYNGSSTGLMKFGAGDDLKIYHDGSNNHIVSAGTGTLRISDGDNSTAFETVSTHGNNVYQNFRHNTHGNTFIGAETDSFVIYTKDSGASSHSTRVNINSSGLAFHSDTADANRINDYEEGTWTPVITFNHGTTGQSYHHQIGRYTKIGNRIFLTCYIQFQNKGSSTGQCRITGIPFQAGNFSHNYQTGACWINSWTGGDTVPTGYIAPNGDHIRIERQDASSATAVLAMDESNFGNSTDLMFSVNYIV